MYLKKIIAAATLVLPALASQAGTVTLTTAESEFTPGTLNQGWTTAMYSSLVATNDNHLTGFAGSAEYRSYYTFDLSGVSGSVTGASLRVLRGGQNGHLTLNLWDVSTPAASVNNKFMGNKALFDDLGSGNAYGQFSVPEGAQSEYLNFVLNAQALTDILNGDRFFTIGASVTTANQYLFGYTGQDVSSLVLETSPAATPADVPEPATLTILLAGLGGIAALRRRT